MLFIRNILSDKRLKISQISVKILFISYLLSLIFPNTIVVITLLPLLKLIIERVKNDDDKKDLSTNLVLSLIYGANIGGMGSMIGASSNVFFLAYIEVQKTPGREKISFFPWLMLGIPFSLLLLYLGKIVLNLGRKNDLISVLPTIQKEKQKKSKINKFILFVSTNLFIILILSAIQYFIKPDVLINNPQFNLVDVIFIIYLSLFLIIAFIYPRGDFSFIKIFKNIMILLLNIIMLPLIYLSEIIDEINVRFNFSIKNRCKTFLNFLYKKLWFGVFKEEKASLKGKNSLAYISFNTMIYDLPFFGLTFMGLVIGGLFFIMKIGDNPNTKALDGFVYNFIGNLLNGFVSADMSLLILLAIIVLSSIFFTEIINNTTIMIIMFSLIGGMAKIVHINPIYLMLAVTISSTTAFMTPIASPVNAIAYAGIRGVSLKRMMLKGFILNIFSAILIIIVFYLLNL